MDWKAWFASAQKLEGVRTVEVYGREFDTEHSFEIEEMFQAFKSRLLDELHVSAKMTPEEHEQWRKDMVRKNDR